MPALSYEQQLSAHAEGCCYYLGKLQPAVIPWHAGAALSSIAEKLVLAGAVATPVQRCCVSWQPHVGLILGSCVE